MKRYRKLLNELRNKYYNDLIEDNKKDGRKLQKSLNCAMNAKKDNPLPDSDSDNELANKFATYFNDKIESIHEEIRGKNYGKPTYSKNTNVTPLSEFHELTNEDVIQILKNNNGKSCELDPIPTKILLKYKHSFVPILKQIINTSLKAGEFPDGLKIAIIRPLLKKLGLELILKNYRPVANLPFVGKLIEKAVWYQTHEHVKENGLDDDLQSSYKPGYSTETALIKVQNDILNEIDKGKAVILLLLDLSAAFDMVDHQLLLDILRNKFRIEGTALKWFKSYLTGRKWKVVINGTYSCDQEATCGVPQGSILGPLLFNMYLSDLHKIAENSNMYRKSFADDNQLYTAFIPKYPSNINLIAYQYHPQKSNPLQK